jgi:hypothetical protein
MSIALQVRIEAMEARNTALETRVAELERLVGAQNGDWRPVTPPPAAPRPPRKGRR